MVDIKVLQGDDAREGARAALKARLYVSGWQLSSDLLEVRDGLRTPMVILGLAYKNGAPVAVVLIHTKWHRIAAFCKKSERRQGIATQIINKIVADTGYDVSRARGGDGVDGSRQFWKAVGAHG